MTTFKCDKPALKLNAKKMAKGQSFEVTYPVSYRYNGGITIAGKWYEGFEVPAPEVPEGWQLQGIGVGLQLNCRPPVCTKVLSKINK